MDTKIKSKNCGKCGTPHNVIPGGATLQLVGDKLDGYYWNCEALYNGETCNSTLWVPLAKLDALKEAA